MNKAKNKAKKVVEMSEKVTCEPCIWHCRNSVRLLNIKCHIVAKKCHNVTRKCHAMTSCGYDNNQKTQGQFVGCVKVRFFAHPLIKFILYNSVTTNNYSS